MIVISEEDLKHYLDQNHSFTFNFMALNSISQCLFAPLRRTRFFLTVRHHSHSQTNASNADDYWNLLKQNALNPNLEKSLTETRGSLDSSIVEEILKRCSIRGSLIGLRFFIWAGLQSDYRHSMFMYNKICKFFKIERYPQSLSEVLQAYRKEGSLVNVKMFKVILNLCREARLAEEALIVLRKMKEFNCRPDTTMFNVVIRLFSEKGNMDVARQLMQEMALVDLYPDMITYVAMVRGYCNVGRLDEACGLFKVMWGHGCVPSTVAYSTLLDGVCKNGDLDKAMVLLGEMEKEGNGVMLNVVTYTSVIQSFCQDGRTMEAMTILDQMREQGCLPNRITVITLIKGLCMEGHIEEAYTLIDKVVTDSSVSIDGCYSSLILALLPIKNVEEAKKVFDKMLASGMRPNGLACSSLIKQLCLEGQVLDAFDCHRKMENIGCVTSVYANICSVLLQELCQQGHLVEAAKLVNLMIDKGIRLNAPHSNGIVEYLQKSGGKELAWHLTSIGK